MASGGEQAEWAANGAAAPGVCIPTLAQVQAMPKVELHAHLSGSISQQKLAELVAQRGGHFEEIDCKQDMQNGLAMCFGYFRSVTEVVTDLDTLRECTLHVLDAFAADNCIYLELRTSPKQLVVSDAIAREACAEEMAGGGVSSLFPGKFQYMETVQAAIQEWRAAALGARSGLRGPVMDVRILVSIDRGQVHSVADALEQVDDAVALASKFPKLVVGFDICGNPSKASVVPYVIPALLQRRDAFNKLPITFHTGELPDAHECSHILGVMGELNIRRLGHVCYFPEEYRTKVLAGGLHADGGAVGIELCPTSNSVARACADLKEHHFPDWWQQSDKVLLSINTDDRGLFCCELSDELHNMAVAFNLSVQDLFDIQMQAVQSSFHEDKAKLLRFVQAAARGSEESAGAMPAAHTAERQAKRRRC